MTKPRGEVEQAEVQNLVLRSREGDHEAFRQLVERKKDTVFRVAYHQTGSTDDARTIAQAVFVRLWKSLDRYDPARPFDTWLHQVTVNAAIDHHRRRQARAQERPLDEARHAAASTAPDALEAREIQGILSELLVLLTEKQRAAFQLREVEGLSTGEVAKALGTTESTVRNHVFQARRILRDALTTRYPEYSSRLGRS